MGEIPLPRAESFDEHEQQQKAFPEWKSMKRTDIRIEIGSCSQEGLYHNNEDRVVYKMELNHQIDGFVGVFDGHGGENCVSYVASHLSRFLKKFFVVDADWEAGDVRMKEMFHNIEEEFVKIANEEDDTSGTCATVAIVKGFDVLVANIGDVKAIAVPNPKQPSQFKVLTGDHRADAEDELRRIEKAGGSVVEGRVNNLQPSRSFGDIDVKEVVGENVIIPTPEVSNARLDVGGFLVVATDGLWDHVSEEKVLEFVSKELLSSDEQADVNQIAADLVALAVKSDSVDDITVTITRWLP